MGAIWAFKSISDQLDPFWLSLESHFGVLIEPEQLYLLVYMSICLKWYLKEPFWLQLGVILFYTCFWISGEPKWLPKGPPLNTEVWLPPESHFGSSSFMCVLLHHFRVRIRKLLRSYHFMLGIRNLLKAQVMIMSAEGSVTNPFDFLLKTYG